MGRTVILILFLSVYWIECNSHEINYNNCLSIEDMITRETQEISNTHPSDNEELAELYVSRAESYLLNAQYEKAIEDFQSANSHLGNFRDINAALIVAFRAVFGEIVSYDNLGMQEYTQRAIEHLQAIVDYIVCVDCAKCLHNQETISQSTNALHFRDMIVICKKKSNKQENQQGSQPQQQDNYEDILGPNQSSPDWCEEVIVGAGRAMDAIACLAPNYAVKIALIGVIETLIARGVKCCQAGGFWKACVAPISRKWREWNNNRAKQVPLNTQNLPLYIN